MAFPFSFLRLAFHNFQIFDFWHRLSVVKPTGMVTAAFEIEHLYVWRQREIADFLHFPWRDSISGLLFKIINAHTSKWISCFKWCPCLDKVVSYTSVISQNCSESVKCLQFPTEKAAPKFGDKVTMKLAKRLAISPERVWHIYCWRIMTVTHSVTKQAKLQDKSWQVVLTVEVWGRGREYLEKRWAEESGCFSVHYSVFSSEINTTTMNVLGTTKKYIF